MLACMHVCVSLCLSVSVCLCVCRTRRLSQSVSRHPCVCTHMSAGHRHITSDSASSTVAAAQAHISQTLEPGTIVSLISKSELRCPHLAHGVTDAMTVPCYFPRLTWSMRDARFPPQRPVPSAAGGNPRSERVQCSVPAEPSDALDSGTTCKREPLGLAEAPTHSRARANAGAKALLTHERERMQVPRPAGCN